MISEFDHPLVVPGVVPGTSHGRLVLNAIDQAWSRIGLNPMIADNAAINAGFDFRRCAMKPTLKKPRIIMAHVEGSGTAEIFTVIGPTPAGKVPAGSVDC